MENASKALIIAGGILLALLTLAILIYTWRVMGNTVKEDDTQKNIQQIAAFNAQYTSYQKRALYGADVASVINKIIDNNKEHVDNPDYQINWEFKLTEKLELDNTTILPAGTYDQSKYSAYVAMMNNASYFKEFKSLYFKCTSVEYSNKTGRVNKIVFEQIKPFHT